MDSDKIGAIIMVCTAICLTLAMLGYEIYWHDKDK